MLSYGTLRGIKPQATTYKIDDRDGIPPALLDKNSADRHQHR